MEKFFHLAAAKTSVKQELIAGLTTFLAMIYIVPVNANIMSIAGMPFDALVTATALITIIATLFPLRCAWMRRCRGRVHLAS